MLSALRPWRNFFEKKLSPNLFKKRYINIYIFWRWPHSFAMAPFCVRSLIFRVKPEKSLAACCVDAAPPNLR